VLIFSNTNLPEQEFSAQKEKVGRVASYDRDTRSWYTWIPLDRAERAAEMLTTLFETVQTVRLAPSAARLCAICAASAHGARGCTSHNPPVVFEPHLPDIILLE
jgi:hypothetical protein